MLIVIPVNATRESLFAGLEAARAGNRLSDISHTIQSYVESKGFSVVRSLVGHGIGKELHEEPEIPNFGPPGKGVVLKPGMALAIEPMVNQGSHEVNIEEDGWAVTASDRSLSAHFEHTVVITDDKPEIITKWQKKKQ